MRHRSPSRGELKDLTRHRQRRVPVGGNKPEAGSAVKQVINRTGEFVPGGPE